MKFHVIKTGKEGNEMLDVIEAFNHEEATRIFLDSQNISIVEVEEEAKVVGGGEVKYESNK